MVRHVAPNGAVYHEPPYTEAEEADFYRRTGNGIVGVMSGPRPPADPQPQPHKSPPPPPAK
jgi:hypothetical protein